MKEVKLNIVINKPAGFVFDFVADPKNTPKWIDSIVKEETNEWPVKLGTVYRNQNKAGEWFSYKMTSFDKNKSFVMSQQERSYHVEYTLKPKNKDSCELEYYEWTDVGELEEVFTIDILEKLKRLIESR